MPSLADAAASASASNVGSASTSEKTSKKSSTSSEKTSDKGGKLDKDQRRAKRLERLRQRAARKELLEAKENTSDSKKASSAAKEKDAKLKVVEKTPPRKTKDAKDAPNCCPPAISVGESPASANNNISWEDYFMGVALKKSAFQP